MSVTVVIVSYNSGPLLIECVRSVLRSDLPIEVVVSDNGSTDGAPAALIDMAVDDARLKVHLNHRNLGFSRGNNAALPLTSSEYLLFLNPDCIVAADTISTVLASLRDRPDAAMIGCRIENVDGTEEPSCNRPLPTPGLLVRAALAGRSSALPDCQTGLLEAEAISGAFMLCRRVDIEALGGFDPGYFMHWEDLDLCMRLRQAGRRILYLGQATVIHYKGRSSARRPLRVEWYKHAGMLRYLRKFHLRGVASPLLLPLAGLVVCRFALRTLRAGWVGRTRADSRSHVIRVSSEMEQCPDVVVFGATSVIGQYLLPRLLAAGCRVVAVTRNPHLASGAFDTPGLTWLGANLDDPGAMRHLARVRHVINLAPIHRLLPQLPGLFKLAVEGIIAFSSTSVLTKQDSAVESERSLVRALSSAEEQVRLACEAKGVPWVILQPTMVYSLGSDRNITKLWLMIRLCRFLPIPGAGNGLRQPVHADDLAIACTELLGKPDAWRQTYIVGGGEVLDYRTMIERLFLAQGFKPRVIPTPMWLLRLAWVALRVLPGLRGLNFEMVRRIGKDMAFSNEAARQAFGYAPREFLAKARCWPPTDDGRS